MSIKRGSSVDRVGLQPQSNVAASDPTTGMNPIALPDEPLAVNRGDGGSNEPKLGGVTNCAPGAGAGFKANDGCANP